MFPETNPFEELYNNPKSELNADLHSAILEKIGAILKTARKYNAVGMENCMSSCIKLMKNKEGS